VTCYSDDSLQNYDPTTGRYIQADPIGLAGDPNPYAYALGNPLRYTDPSGEWAQVVAGAVLGAGLGAGLDAAMQAWGVHRAGGNVFDARCYDWGSIAFSGVSGALGGRLPPGLRAINSPIPSRLPPRTLGTNPFKGKTPDEIAAMFNAKGFVPRGPDPAAGVGSYVNPRTGRGYHLNANHPPPKPPHVGVHRPRGQRGNFDPRDYDL
jgi:hypothetical protein